MGELDVLGMQQSVGWIHSVVDCVAVVDGCFVVVVVVWGMVEVVEVVAGVVVVVVVVEVEVEVEVTVWCVVGWGVGILEGTVVGWNVGKGVGGVG